MTESWAKRRWDYRALIVRVVDGDTVELDVDLGFDTWHTGSFRLIGINAIEHNQPGGQEAKANLGELLPLGSEVHLSSVKADKYGGRYDAALTTKDGIDVSTHLIITGWAAPWLGQGPKPLPAWPRKPA